MGGGLVDELAGVYAGFAEHEARGRSPLYEELARGVAADREVLTALAELPRAKRQPNLVFAALRYVCGTPDGWPEFRVRFLARRDEIVALVLARRTQTNEPARCATLLPALALLPQPLALLEVGASAGLCLIPDRYAYDYAGPSPTPSRRSTPSGSPTSPRDCSETPPDLTSRGRRDASSSPKMDDRWRGPMRTARASTG